MEPIKSLNLYDPPDPAPPLRQRDKYPVPFINLHETLKFDTQCLNRVVDMILALFGPHDASSVSKTRRAAITQSVLPFTFSGEQEKKVQTSAAQKANAHDPIYPLPLLEPMGKERCSMVDDFDSQPLHKKGAVLHMRHVQCMKFAAPTAEVTLTNLPIRIDLKFFSDQAKKKVSSWETKVTGRSITNS
jgi:hypothetical protein